MIHAPKTFATLGFALSLASGGPATNAHGIERTEGLVHQQDLGLQCQGARNL